MSAVAWRLSREDRRRSEARIAALSSALATPEPGERRTARLEEVERRAPADRLATPRLEMREEEPAAVRAPARQAAAGGGGFRTSVPAAAPVTRSVRTERAPASGDVFDPPLRLGQPEPAFAATA